MAGTPITSVDALVPAEMARRAEDLGVQKANMDVGRTFVLAVLAGAFIAFGAVFSTTASTGATEQLPYGIARLVSGVTFSLGLVLVVVGGAELFTGNNLIVMAWAGGKITSWAVLRNWAVDYVGNLIGAIGTAVLVYAAGQHQLGSGAVGVTALRIAEAKCSLGFGQAVALGMLCNTLVCLAVWLTYSARTTTDRILAIVPPITAFVAVGFEHSIANMYFIPFGLLIKRDALDANTMDSAVQFGELSQLTWSACFLNNLLPVTIGNVIGGSLMVGVVYWFVYLRTGHGEKAPG